MPRKKRFTKPSTARRAKSSAPARRAQMPSSGRVTRIATVTWAVCLSVLVAAAAVADRRPAVALIVVAVCAGAAWLVIRTGRPGACTAVLCGIVGLKPGMTKNFKVSTYQLNKEELGKVIDAFKEIAKIQ